MEKVTDMDGGKFEDLVEFISPFTCKIITT